jgi:hypothetical protein
LHRLQEALAKIAGVGRAVARIEIEHAKETAILREKEAISGTVLAQMGREAMVLQRKKSIVNEKAETEKEMMEALPPVKNRRSAALKADEEHRRRIRAARDSITRETLLSVQSLAHSIDIEAVFAAVSVMVRWNIEPRDLDVSWRTGGSRLAATPDELLALLGESTTAEYSESQLDLAEQQLERTEEATLKEALQNLREWVVLTVEYYRFKKSTFDPATAEYTKTQKSLSTLREQAAGVKSDIEMLGERVESLKLAYVPHWSHLLHLISSCSHVVGGRGDD